jgi:hypothetical protein
MVAEELVRATGSMVRDQEIFTAIAVPPAG